MITLGSFDSDVTSAARDAYLTELRRLTRVAITDVAPGVDRITLTPLTAGTLRVADVQRALVTLGFFPGGKVDGICGYRTRSAIRLFQEYLRTHGDPAIRPHGQYDVATQGRLQQWIAAGTRPDWEGVVESWRGGTVFGAEYHAWLSLIGEVQRHAVAQPGKVDQLVDARTGGTDTRRPGTWDTSASHPVHLIGIRRSQASGKFDDIFVLLIKGLVFKFQGSTEPGASENPAGPPYLVRGQHNYHFGWHKRSYLALRPESAGVLIIRSGANRVLDDADLARGLEANPTINIHWGGRGLRADINKWSEGCQVINGSLYVDHRDQLIDCRAFAAVRPSDVSATVTRGAYNVLLDLVTALASDGPPTVLYTLLNESDLELDVTLRDGLAATRARVAVELAKE